MMNALKPSSVSVFKSRSLIMIKNVMVGGSPNEILGSTRSY